MREIPQTAELFTIPGLVERHRTILTESRVRWAIRNRHKNGLSDAVFKTKGDVLLVHESAFIRWFLGLDGRAKPRSPRSTNHVLPQ